LSSFPSRIAFVTSTACRNGLTTPRASSHDTSQAGEDGQCDHAMMTPRACDAAMLDCW
jgi:hypothetical protein